MEVETDFCNPFGHCEMLCSDWNFKGITLHLYYLLNVCKWLVDTQNSDFGLLEIWSQSKRLFVSSLDSSLPKRCDASSRTKRSYWWLNKNIFTGIRSWLWSESYQNGPFQNLKTQSRQSLTSMILKPSLNKNLFKDTNKNIFLD